MHSVGFQLYGFWGVLELQELGLITPSLFGGYCFAEVADVQKTVLNQVLRQPQEEVAVCRIQGLVGCFKRWFLATRLLTLLRCHLLSLCAASNYRQGRAEAAIGRALSLLLLGNTASDFPESRLEVTRDALFISSKAGYLTSGGTMAQFEAAHCTAVSCWLFDVSPLSIRGRALTVGTAATTRSTSTVAHTSSHLGS
jgi:hypothetical protein